MKVNDKVKVIRPNLMNTGKFGTIVEITNGISISVLIDNKTYTFNKGSLQVVNEQVKPKIVDTYLPIEDGSVVFMSDLEGRLKLVPAKAVYIKDNKVFDATGDITKRYLGFYPKDKPIDLKLLKYNPEWEDSYPYFCDGMVSDITIALKNVWHIDFKDLTFEHNNYLYSLDWCDLNVLFKQLVCKGEVKVFEVKDDEVLNAAELLTTKYTIDHKTQGLCFGIVYKDKFKKGGVGAHNRVEAACHYAFRGMLGKVGNKDNALFGVQYITDKFRPDEECVKHYLEWVIKNSPWSRYIVNKDKPLEELYKTGVYVKLDIPSNAMMCTYYALRYPTEFMDKIKVWDKAVKEGMNPNLAFFYAETDKFNRNTCGHHQLLNTYHMDIDSLKGFIKGKVGKVIAPIYLDYNNYQNVSMHHGLFENPVKTAIEYFNDNFKGSKKVVNHPVLGKQEKIIPPVEQIKEWADKVLLGDVE